MTTVEVASLVASYLMGASRLLQSTSVLWSKIPGKLAVLLPAVVLVLPKLAEQFGLVKTDMDMVSVVAVAVAMLLPGAAAAKSA